MLFIKILRYKYLKMNVIKNKMNYSWAITNYDINNRDYPIDIPKLYKELLWMNL